VHTTRWFPGSVFGPGVVGSVATLGAVAAGAAIVEAALIPGLLIGGAAMLAPRLLPRDMLNGLGDRRWRRIAPSAPTARSAEVTPVSGEPAVFDTGVRSRRPSPIACCSRPLISARITS
jgi:hypothetical protein